MIRKMMLILLTGVIMLQLTACGTSQIRRTFFVEAMGIDWEDDQYLLTVQVFDPYIGPSTVGELTEPATTILTATGESLSECMVDLVRQMGRRPFFSQTRVIILGEDLAKQGISASLNMLERDYETRLNVDVFIAHGKAGEAVSSKMRDANSPTEEMLVLAQGNDYSTEIVRTQLLQLQKAVYQPMEDLAVPAVSLQEDADGNKNLYMDGCALLMDDKLVDFLSPEETIGLVYFNDQVKDGVSTFEMDKFGRVSVEVLKSNTDIDTKIVDGKPEFTVKVDCEATLQEINVTHPVELTDDDYSQMNELFSQDLEKHMKETLELTVRQQGIDVFRLGRRVLQEDEAYWESIQENWREIIKNVQVNFEVNAEVVRAGKLNFQT